MTRALRGKGPTQIDGSGRTPATEGEPLALMWNKASVFQAAKRRKNFARWGWIIFETATHGLRHGLYSVAASRLGTLGLLRFAYAALLTCGWAQWAQRRASMGISLRHSVHFFVVGSAGAGSLRMRATSALTGVTTKK